MERHLRSRGWPLAPIAWLLGVPATASAHLVSTGLGPVYDGVTHFLMSPEVLAPVLGLAILAGQRGSQHGRWALFAVTAAWLAGSLTEAGLVGSPVGHAPLASLTPWMTAATCLTIGGLIAADLKLPLPHMVALTTLIGFMGGAMNANSAGTQTELLVPFGVAGAVFVLVALTASLIVPLRILWLRVAVRVAGSWLAALGLLVFGWTIRTAALHIGV